MLKPKHPKINFHRIAISISLLLFAAGLSYQLILGFSKPNDVGAASCNVDGLLVNSCGPWLGAWANNYGSAPLKAAILDHESRIGRQLGVIHNYHPVGNLPLSTDEKYFAARANTVLLVNWKPADPWSDAKGNNGTVNAQIDQVADSIKSIAPTKILLTLYHEPEDNVTPGTSSCSNLKGSSGSPADYRAMWANVRSRFDAKGVTNVVWAMNYMGYSTWDCLVPEMWPGNSLVDWVMWDPYGGNNQSWNSTVSRFYNFLTSNSDTDHAYSSKVWGLAEWGTWDTNQANVYKFYDDAAAALAAGTFPKLKLYAVFDALGTSDSRVSYNNAGGFDATEQSHYNSLANSAYLAGSAGSGDGGGGGSGGSGGAGSGGSGGSGSQGSGGTQSQGSSQASSSLASQSQASSSSQTTQALVITPAAKVSQAIKTLKTSPAAFIWLLLASLPIITAGGIFIVWSLILKKPVKLSWFKTHKMRLHINMPHGPVYYPDPTKHR